MGEVICGVEAEFTAADAFKIKKLSQKTIKLGLNTHNLSLNVR
jgi:hypothetical protein